MDDEYDQREWFDKDSTLVGKQAALADWYFKKDNQKFEKLIAVLRAVKWNKEHPEKRKAIAAAYYRNNPRAKERQLALARKRRAAKPPAKVICLECRSEFSRKRKGVKPAFCRDACRLRFRYQERTPGARRITRRAA